MRLNFDELLRIIKNKKSDHIRTQRFDVFITSFSRYKKIKIKRSNIYGERCDMIRNLPENLPGISK